MRHWGRSRRSTYARPRPCVGPIAPCATPTTCRSFRCRGSGCQIVPVEAWGSPCTIALSHHDERRQASAIAADGQFPVDGLVFEGSCSEVFLDPGRHVFCPRLPMTDRRLPGAAGRTARALRTAVGCGWPLIRIVLRRGSAPQERDCDKGITRCNRTHRHVVLRWLFDQNGKNSARGAVAV